MVTTPDGQLKPTCTSLEEAGLHLGRASLTADAVKCDKQIYFLVLHNPSMILLVDVVAACERLYTNLMTGQALI